MNMTVIRRTGLGFALLLALMTVIAGAALQTQQTTQRSMTQMADEVLPLLQSGYSVLITAQNINKAISQHAAESSTDLLETYEQNFQSEVAQYEDLHASLLQQLDSSDSLIPLLDQADQAIRRMIEDGTEHLSLHRDVLSSESAYQSEVQSQTSPWLRLPNDMQIVDRVIEVLSAEQDSQSSLISADTSYVREKIDLVRNNLAGSALMDDVDEVEALRERLRQEVSNTWQRIDRLEENNNILHQRLAPYVQLVDHAVNDNDGTMALQLTLLREQERSRNLLNHIAEDINLGIAALQGLTTSIAAESNRLQQDMQSRGQTSAATIAGTYIVSLVLALVIVISLIRSIRQPLKRIVKVLDDISSGDLTSTIDLKGRDEFATIAHGINQLSQRLREVLLNIADTSGRVSGVTDQVSSTTEKNREKLRNQKEQTDSVATSVTEMASATEEVARSADGTLAEVEAVQHGATEGQNNMVRSVEAINTLEQDLEKASEAINELNEESDNIGNILSVIKGIAEQTNLLALNAAIEAARAGEQGRGFAVVADEVRDLARKTQSSTEEIYGMIDALQSRSRDAVSLMERNRKQSRTVVAQTEETSASIDEILASLNRIKDMMSQIATAAGQQRSVATEVSGNTVLIADMADDVVRNAARNAEAFHTLAKLTREQEALLKQFRFK